ncbi:hypothetical protein GCM10010915_07980 [Microbacterium faecale]|uniref:DUF2442 domain-containing protein n=1 Tax=Microbacterium faecale TaxID=1804630 RepID=A0A917DE80_9MICO|nr:DUF2442 domain-containing protein [Microbacterium faecale]GGD30119.1 hypothetical protein GCM10010915_07980 [Microbacterium faecale]
MGPPASDYDFAVRLRDHVVARQTHGRSAAVTLRDGRRIAVSLVRFPRLANGSDAARADWRIIGAGEGIHWPQLVEGVPAAGILAS